MTPKSVLAWRALINIAFQNLGIAPLNAEWNSGQGTFFSALWNAILKLASLENYWILCAFFLNFTILVRFFSWIYRNSQIIPQISPKVSKKRIQNKTKSGEFRNPDLFCYFVFVLPRCKTKEYVFVLPSNLYFITPHTNMSSWRTSTIHWGRWWVVRICWDWLYRIRCIC